MSDLTPAERTELERKDRGYRGLREAREKLGPVAHRRTTRDVSEAASLARARELSEPWEERKRRVAETQTEEVSDGND